MLAVAACGTQPLPSWLVRYTLGAPPGMTTTTPPRDAAVWTAAGRMEVVTWGSSGCPGLPTRLDVPASNVLTVTVKIYDPSNASCPADLAPTTSVINVPAKLNGREEVTVSILDGAYGRTVSLPGRSAS